MKILLAVCAVWLGAGFFATATDLSLVGRLPELSPEWKLRERGQYGEATFQWHWLVFTNTEGDVLSFASHRLEAGEKRDLIYMSDTAHESFFDGWPMWARKPDNVDTEVIES